MKRVLTILVMFAALTASAQKVTLAGTVVDDATDKPVEFASLLLVESGQWAVSDAKGRFTIRNVNGGRATLTAQCLGYQKRSLTLTLTKDVTNFRLKLKQETLKLDEVTVTAHRKSSEATTSYTIDRTALDNQQVLNIGDIATLLPGGKSVNPTLMDDSRMALRSGSGEKGNASFGTAIEVDGIRLDNNGVAGETAGASTRSLSTSNIESVEVVTGIPSVEYGDLSNGVVKVNTRKGKSPFIVEGKLNQHTRQIALNKGFDLGGNGGVMNVSAEHARSFSDAASPHTAYQRNSLALHYMTVWMRDTRPLTLNVGLSGNVGGYNSEADPDELTDDYVKTRDNNLRASVALAWLPGKPWLTNLELKGTLQYADKRTERYQSNSSASTQPYIHATEEGYFLATEGPTGYWHVRSFNDSKPLTYSLKLKANLNSQFSILNSQTLIGAEFTSTRNNGRGLWYEDMRLAPTWREYRLDELPAMNNLALYLEERATLQTGKWSALTLTAGLRDDITMISGSSYGTVGSLSPRVSTRYVFWKGRRKQTVSDLSLHAGWGRSVKLPSFQTLYPAPTYADRLSFASPSTADNRSYYVYHTYPSRALWNPDLRWQYTDQTDIGIEMTIAGTRISLSAYHHKTRRPYTSVDIFTPMTYRYTAPAALDGTAVAAENRRFEVDRQTGIVTLTDVTGAVDPQQLASTERNTYAVTSQYVNGSSVSRTGLEWIIDFRRIEPLMTSIRLDGNYYYYKGLDDMLIADIPLGVSSTMTGNRPYTYVGWYRGSNATTAGTAASASVSNGALQKQLNMNLTLTTHIPRIRMIVALRVETSLYNYRRQLSETADGGSRGYVLDSGSDYTGLPYDGTTENRHVAVYPEYYTTWDRPDERIPFAERFLWARDNDPALYSDLAKLVVRTNYPYVMNPNRLSAYYSANLSVTKEIGDHVSLSFYANNFLRNMATVHSSQTGLDTSLFGSSYIPDFYYGLSMKLKI